MLNLNDFLIAETLRASPRFKGEINRRKMYRCYCAKCGKDRGYLSKSRYYSKPICVKCSTNTAEHRETLKKNHWKNKGLSPKTWIKKNPESPLKVKIGTNLRSRLNKALKGNYKAGSAVKDLGCTIKEFKGYLESKFQPGMSWDNYGFRGWHIDHIRPLSSFDLADKEQFKLACHYSNLQPLWARDNLRKGSTISYG